jgi:hypothetical protein
MAIARILVSAEDFLVAVDTANALAFYVGLVFRRHCRALFDR